MTEEDLIEIEQTFDIQLPHGYRQLLKSPPNLLVGLMEAFVKEQSDFEVPVFLTSDVIIGQNQEVRDPDAGFVVGPDEDDVWDQELLIIGGDCGGNFYCIKPHSGSSTVYESEYVSLLANTLFGTGTAEAQSWFKKQRHALRHDKNGVRKVLSSAAQLKRRHAFQGSADDYVPSSRLPLSSSL